VLFCWPYSGTSVFLAGTFNDWNPQPMYKNLNSFELTIPLWPARYHYKFVVDGNWYYDICQPNVNDHDNWNNEILVEEKRKVPVPLQNVGDSCYVNTAIQLLLSCSDWVEILGTLYSDPYDGKLLNLFQTYLPSMEFQIRSFLKQLEGILHRSLSGPQDAELFLINLWEHFRNENSQIVDPISYCTLKKLKCKNKQCDWKTGWVKWEDGFSLPLCYDVEGLTVQDVVDYFVKNEETKEEYCNNCKTKNMETKFKLDTRMYLFAHLVPINDSVGSPYLSEILLIKNPNRSTCVYKLQAIGYHDGGHYKACVHQQNTWWICDDHQIYPTELNHQPHEQGKILVYARIN